jgi:ABC-type nitrate/sulfonate/bicarbonate transport system permease component
LAGSRASPLKRVNRTFKKFLVPLVIVIGWEVAARAGWINRLFFPPPSLLLAAAWSLSKAGVLERHALATISRALTGFAIGAASGVAFGLLLSLSRNLRETFKSTLTASFTIPKVTLLPLFMLLMGIGEPSLLMPVILTCFIICALHTLDAAAGIDRQYVELARNYGARRRDLARAVYLPATLPRVFTGLRLALGSGLIITLSCEMLSANRGLGGMIWMGWQTLAIENLFVGVICTSLIGFLFQICLEKLEHWLLPWSQLSTLSAESLTTGR